MKKFILAILLCIFPACACGAPQAITAKALSPQYACIRTDDTYFYASRDDKHGLFLLPESYFVKVLETGADFVYAEYLFDDEYTKKLVGFVKTEKLVFVDFIPKTPYCHRIFEVSYSLENGVSNGSGFLDRITVTCSYYGDYTVGSQKYCYVRRGEEYGYIPKPDTLQIPRNTEYDEWLQSQELPTASPNATPQTQQSSPLQITLLVSACLLVPVLAALVLKTHTHENEMEE